MMAYNATATKSPVHYDLTTSPYEVSVGYFTFRFSTWKHALKFDEEVSKRVEWLNDSMSRRFHVPCAFDNLAMVQLYQQIEGRGFNMVYKGTEFTNVNDITFATVIIGEEM